jgi:ariadne-1
MWNSEKLQEQFWNDPTQALLDAGLSPPSSPSTSTLPLPTTPARRNPRNGKTAPTPKRTKSNHSAPFECPVCCTDYPSGQIEESTLSLGCGHRFCKVCWKEYLRGKIKGDGESGKIQCMESGCQKVVREEVVDQLLDASMSKRYV